MDKTKNATDLAKEYKISRRVVHKIIEKKKKTGVSFKENRGQDLLSSQVVEVYGSSTKF